MFETRGYTDALIKSDFTYYNRCMFDADKRVYVFVDDSDKLNIGVVKECISFMNNEGCRHGIIVYGSSYTPAVKKIVSSDTSFRIELFSRSELGFNVTKHVLVPEHRQSTPDEYAQLSQYADKLPRMFSTDPVARFYGFQKNDIIRIQRPDNTVVFRTVI